MTLHKHTLGESPVASADLNGNNNFALTGLLNYALDGADITNQDNLKLDLFGSDTATFLQFMKYNSGTDLYECIDSTTQAWIVIEATSITEAQLQINGCRVHNIATGKWLMYGSAGDYEVSRAQIMKTLFYGSDGSDPRVVSGITSLTALKSPDVRDVGKQAHYGAVNISGSATTFPKEQITGTFADTSTNTNSSVWSFCEGYDNYSKDQGMGYAYFAAGNQINGAISSDGHGSTSTSDETGTDTSADELDNPANCKLYAAYDNFASGKSSRGTTRMIVLCKGDLTWVENNSEGSYSETDFLTDNSIPVFTASTESDLTCIMITDSTTITTSETVAIIKSLHTLTAGNTITTEVSFDDGSNYQVVTQKELDKIINTGTSAKIKFTITRANNDEADSITSYAYYYGD